MVKGFETMNLPLTRKKFLLFKSDVYLTSLRLTKVVIVADREFALKSHPYGEFLSDFLC